MNDDILKPDWVQEIWHKGTPKETVGYYNKKDDFFIAATEVMKIVEMHSIKSGEELTDFVKRGIDPEYQRQQVETLKFRINLLQSLGMSYYDPNQVIQ